MVILVSHAALHSWAPNSPNLVLLYKVDRFGRLPFMQGSVNPFQGAERGTLWWKMMFSCSSSGQMISSHEEGMAGGLQKPSSPNPVFCARPLLLSGVW